jgi:dTDP-glucose 4,6-dehydratase/UDP-glucuronate decarboxylase
MLNTKINKILVVGASGVIGLNLIKEYTQINHKMEQYEIHAVSKRPIPNFFVENFGLKNIIYYCSISELEDNYFDVIFNCGGPSQPAVFIENPRLTLDANIFKLDELFQKLSENGKFIQMSTSEIYSGCTEKPCTESHRGILMPNNPRRVYVLAKELSELMLETLIKPNQTILIARVSLVFGPGARLNDKRVLYEFIIKGLSGRVSIEGSSNSIRRYLYVSDFILMLNLLIACLPKGFHTYNFCGIEKISIFEMASKIARILKVDIDKKNLNDNRSNGAPEEVWVSNVKLVNKVKNFLFTDFEVGLIQTIDYLKKLSLSEYDSI